MAIALFVAVVVIACNDDGTVATGSASESSGGDTSTAGETGATLTSADTSSSSASTTADTSGTATTDATTTDPTDDTTGTTDPTTTDATTTDPTTGESSTTDTDGTTGDPVVPGQSHSQLVSVGERMSSASYEMVYTLGQPSQLQSTHTSANYRMQAGLIGANGNPP